MIYVACGFFLIFFVGNKHTYNLATICAVFATYSGAKLAVYFTNTDFLRIKNIHAGSINFVIVLVSIIAFLKGMDPKLLVFAVAVCDIVFGICGVVISAVELPHYKLDITELLLGIGDIVFGLLLLFEGPEGIDMHLIFETISAFVTATVIGIELKVELKEYEEKQESK